MVVGAFPAAKLGALLLKQISKPIANVVKNQAKSSPVFRKYVCMPPAQFYNWCEVKAKMWILNLGKPVNIPVLNEAMAIELGANLLGEGIIFLIAAGILLNEYNRSVTKEAAKEAAKQAEMDRIQSQITELFIQSEELSAQMRELFRKIGDQDTTLQEIEKKLGVKKPKHPSPALPTETPPYSPAAQDPNIAKMSAPQEIYTLSSNRISQNCGLILRAVNDIEDQFWNYPIRQGENLVNAGLEHVRWVFRL